MKDLIFEQDVIEKAKLVSISADKIIKVMELAEKSLSNKVVQSSSVDFYSDDYQGNKNNSRILNFIIAAESYLINERLDTQNNLNQIYTIIDKNPFVFMKKEDLIEDSEYRFLIQQLKKSLA